MNDDRQNTIKAAVRVLESERTVNVVELDVRYNTKRSVVLCHDREQRNVKRNENLLCLLINPIPMKIMLDVKAFGISNDCENLAHDVIKLVKQHPQHEYWVCSFNEYCVSELISQREEHGLYKNVHVGVISSGIPMGMFSHLQSIDFVSLEHSVVDPEIVDMFKRKKYMVFAWVVNHPDTINYMVKCGVDGIIQDYYA